MRIRLHAFVRIECEPVPVYKIINNPERNVRIVANPRVCEKHVSKDHETRTSNQRGLGGIGVWGSVLRLR